jgi:hypothetical protein
MRVLNRYDEESTANVMMGGACDKKSTTEDKSGEKEEELRKKKEYLNWCYELVNARKEGNKEDEKKYSDNLLDYLKTHSLKEIDNLENSEKRTAFLKEQGFKDDQIQYKLYNPEEIKEMKEEIKQIWEDPNAQAETNYILKINAMSLLCLAVFSKHSKTDDYSEIETDDNRQILPAITPPWGDTYDAIVPAIKHQMRGFEDSWLGNPNKETHHQTFLVNTLPYLSISELLGSSLEKNIWFLGFLPTCNYFDGDKNGNTFWGNPFQFAVHDANHFRNVLYSVFNNGTSPFGIPINEYDYEIGINDKNEAFEKLKQFYAHCNNKYKNKKDSAKLYSIKLFLFYVFHEDTTLSKLLFAKIDDPEETKKIVKSAEDFDEANSLDGAVERFYNPNDLFGSLPARIQNIRNSECSEQYNKTDLEKKTIVKDYIINECLSNFVDAMHEFQKEEEITTGGGRKSRKMQKNKYKRSKKINKSRHKKTGNVHRKKPPSYISQKSSFRYLV